MYGVDGAEFLGHWDTAVVGAGSAGCALTSRLVTGSDRRVLLLEAGPDFPPPEGWPELITGGSPLEMADYLSVYAGHYTAAQPMAFVVRGRLVGGSSAVNGGIFVRGIAEDYDSWGSPLWSYDSVLPFFIEQENDLDFPDRVIHGSRGPIPVRRPARDSWVAHQRAFYEAVVGCGFGEKEDLAESAGEGVGPVPLNRIDGLRVSAAMGYLDPIRSHPNLSISAGTSVVRLLWDGRKVAGVIAERDGQMVWASADEIVLSTSGIMSPHILIHSGIGPGATLSRLGLPVVNDLAGVGQNFHDHPVVSVQVAAPEPFLPRPDDPWFQTMLVMTCDAGVGRNDMHIYPLGMSMDQAVGISIHENALSYDACMQLPLSAGHLEFGSADPSDLPALRFGYLEHELDRRRFREAIEVVLRILGHPAMSALGPRLAPTDEDLASDAALDAWMAHNLSSAFHTSGTCRMGPGDDPAAVVDFEGRVHGVDNLRIADLSIAPNVVRAPENATATMIGQRIGDLMIKG